MRMCTSAAPASRSSATSLRVVLPRTIESSTTTSRLPAIACLSGLSFRRMPCWRSVWVGEMKVRPDVAVLREPLAVRDARSRARSPIAAGMPESGTPMTRSASTGASRGERRAHPPARLVQRAVVDHASPAARSRRTRTCTARASRPGRPAADSTPVRRDLDRSRRARRRARTRRRRCRARTSRSTTTQPRSSSLPEHERAHAVRVAEGVERLLGDDHDRVGARDELHRLARCRRGWGGAPA